MSQRPPAKKTTKKPRPWWKRLKWKRLALLLTIFFVFLFFIVVGAMYVFARVPEPKDLAVAQSIVVVDHTGKNMGRISSADADRISVPLKQMPDSLRHAVIATEDRHFYKHHGIRVTSIFRAALANVFGHGVEQGGSTITQQYVKNAFVGSQRTFLRKINEAVLAVKFERKHSKDEILEDYLNTIYFGRGAYGCEAASSSYFGKHCRDLTLAQSALLAGIIQAPESYAPTREREKAKARRDQVLDFMVRDHYVTQQEADTAKAVKVTVRYPLPPGGIAPHYFEEVRHEVERRLGGALYKGGVRVKVSLDLRMQQDAEKAVRDVLPKDTDPDVALVAIDPRNGAVRAWIGSRSYQKLQTDLVLAHRRPGSSFKPMVLATAVKQGVSTREVFTAPPKIDIGGTTYANFDNESFGTLDVEQATWHSVNTVFVQLIKKVGIQNTIETARALGINSPLSQDAGLALGDSNVTPLELATAYATFAARGARHDPYLVEEVTDSTGHKLFTARSTAFNAIDHDVADTVTSVLQGVIQSGTGRAAAIGRPAAGKTGTTDEHRDAWFAGYTPQLAAVVWTGYAAEERAMTNVRGIKVTGGTFPAQMWSKFMSNALEGVPPAPFVKAPPQPSPSGSISASPSPSPSPSPTRPGPTPLPTGTIPAPSPTPTPSRTPSPTASASPKSSAAPSPVAT